MQRDLDLIVKILMEVEAQPPSLAWSELPIMVQGSSEERLLHQFHLDLLIDAGFVTCPMPERVRMGTGLRLTWSGCEFLDTFRDDTLRRKAVKTLGSTSLEVLRILAVEAAVQGGRTAMGLLSRHIGESIGP